MFQPSSRMAGKVLWRLSNTIFLPSGDQSIDTPTVGSSSSTVAGSSSSSAGSPIIGRVTGDPNGAVDRIFFSGPPTPAGSVTRPEEPKASHRPSGDQAAWV